jgi:outer membrane protein OmpA-like peptidoglycan-associated protein/tetratricopeptide (TPR) repeat protein
MIQKLFIFFLVLFHVKFVFAQDFAKSIKKAESHAKNYSYVNSIETYQQILRKSKSLNPEETLRVKLGLAAAYFYIKDYRNAEKYYAEIVNANTILKGDDLKAYLRYAQVLSSNGKHAESAKYWTKYSDLQEQDRRGLEFSKLYTNLDPLTRNASSYRVEYVGINTSNPDFSPAFYKDGLVFVSGRTKSNSVKRVFKWDNSSFLDLYYLEDLKLLGKEDVNAAIGASGGQEAAATKTKTNLDKLGNDYYTPPTANDGNTIAHNGSDFISGNKDEEEISGIAVKKFSKSLNSKYHEGPCTFFHTSNKIIFTRNNSSFENGVLGQKKAEINKLKLFTAEKKGADWINIKELPFNSSEFSNGHPAINFKDNLLYFVSDRPGGYGGTDLYCVKYVNGKWLEPVNLGGKVNTLGNEMFPFVDESGGVYFSSDGHPGLGDLDIFYFKSNQISGLPESRVRNLGAPLNSMKDDFGIITDPYRSVGYFSSNRKRGGADDDIYKFNRVGSLYGCRDLLVSVCDEDKTPIEKIKFEYGLSGDSDSPKEQVITNETGTIKLCLEADAKFVFDFERVGYISQTKVYSNTEASDFEPSELKIILKKIPLPLPVVADLGNQKEKKKNRELMVLNRNSNQSANIFKGIITGGENGTPISAVKVRFINKCTGEIQETYTKKDGSYEFKRDIECDYELVAAKDDFGLSTEIVEKIVKRTFFRKKIKKNVSLNLFDTKLYKVGDVIKLENIYYDTESFVIRENAKRELDKLSKVLKRYPNMLIEVSSHTDTRGNAIQNLRLSQQRAVEVSKYIISTGIDKSRIKALGKGESEPLNACSDGVQCTEAEHQRNRRTEFKILTIEKR